MLKCILLMRIIKFHNQQNSLVYNHTEPYPYTFMFGIYLAREVHIW